LISRLSEAAALALLAFAAPAFAQATSCRLPSEIPPARAVSPPPDEARRSVPVAGYLLALSWSPEYCRTRAASADDRLQCGSGNRFGFILHGLWPEASGPAAPRWCRPAPPLPPALVRENLCATPSVQLMQHEWAKHGTCAARSPVGYFKAASRLYASIRYPDMDALSRRPLSVRAFRQAFARANPGVTPAMLRVDANERGWLREVRLCLGVNLKPRPCAAFSRGENDTDGLKIWRGR